MPPFLCLGHDQPSWIGNRIERCLSYDEKPLLLFQKLKDAKKNPVFMLKHIKDIRSPIAVAQQKQAARKASETPSSSQSRGSSSADRPSLRPPLLQVQSAILGSNSQQPGHLQPGFLTGGNSKSGWPEAMSPAIDNKDRHEDPSSSLPSTSTTDPGTHHQESSGPTVNVKEPMPSGTGTLSYAVAIYPYMAEQEDEFDVVVYASQLPRMRGVLLTIVPFTEAIHLSLYQERGVGGWFREILKAVDLSKQILPSKVGYLLGVSSRPRSPSRWPLRKLPISPVRMQLAPPNRSPERQSCRSASYQQVSPVSR